jgi:hypothetical protein
MRQDERLQLGGAEDLNEAWDSWIVLPIQPHHEVQRVVPI